MYLCADPFGKDADLVKNPCCIYSVDSKEPIQSPLALVGNTLISFHQNVISPADGPRSHFKPSSSEYTKQAIVKYGFFLGVPLGCDRLMRENSDPWIYDTVKGEYGTTFKFNPVK